MKVEQHKVRKSKLSEEVIKEIKKFGGNYFVETSAGRRKVYMSKEILTELKSKCNIN